MEGSQLWITTLVVLCGLSLNSYGQKTFRRACDCEYMVDGKCAYTLLLPSGQGGEGMCPPSSNTDSRNDEMPEDMQQRVNDLHRNYTQLLSMYSSQATMLNQVYSTLMDKLLGCPLLQSCAMQGMNVPTFTVPEPTVNIPDQEMPGVTIPDVEMEVPDMEKPSITDPEMPEITMPDIGMEMPEEVTMPNVEIPVPKCVDVCPDLESQLESMRIMSGEIDQTLITNVADIVNITNQIRYINATLDELLIRVVAGSNGSNSGNGQPVVPMDGGNTGGGLGNQQPPIPGGGGMPNGDLPGQMGAQNGLNVNLASLALWVNNIVNNGALCLQKGPLVSGDDESIPDESITASRVFNDQHIASRVRIYSEDDGDLKGAWCPGKTSCNTRHLSNITTKWEYNTGNLNIGTK